MADISRRGPQSQDLNEGLGEDQMLPFCRLSKALPKAFCGKQSWQAHQNDFAQTQGQAQEETRTARGHFKNQKKN